MNVVITHASLARILLALDLGSKTGWMVGNDSYTASGVIELKGTRYEGGGMRFLRFRRWLSDLHDVTPFDEVVYEEVRRHLGTDAAHIYGGLQATLCSWCEDRTPVIPYTGVPVQTIKKFATGKGNASKTEVIAAVMKWGRKPQDDNEADAIALFNYRRSGAGGVS